MQIQDAKAQGMWLMVWPDVSEKQLSRHPYPGISASPKEWNITIFFFFIATLCSYTWEVSTFGCKLKMFEIGKEKN